MWANPALHRIRPLVDGDAQDVLLVMAFEQLHVARRLGVTRRLEPFDLGEHLLVHLRHQHAARVLVVRGDAHHHVGDHEPLEVPLILQRVLGGEDATP